MFGELDSEESETKENLVDEFFMKENNNLNDPRFREVKKEIEKFFSVPNKQVIDYVKNFIIKDKFLRTFEGENKEVLYYFFLKIITLNSFFL